VNKKKQLKVTFVVRSENPSGGQRVIAIYADRLARRGHEVTIVVPSRRSLNIRDRARAFVRKGIWLPKENKTGQSYFRNAPFNVRWLDHSGPVTDRDLPDADVLIANWWGTVAWVWKASASKGVKLHFMQDYEAWGAPGGDVAQVDAAISLPIPKIVIAQWVADLLDRRWAQTPIALIHNSVRTEQFYAPPRGKQAVPTVGFAYTAMRNKGCDVIVSAIERSRLLISNLRVISFGQARPTPEVPLPSGTEFHFQVEDEKLRHLYSRCDAWLFGTRIEGFGLPILEAMACRTPVIGTPAGAAPRLIGQGGGILVGMEDIGGMSEAIARISAMSEAQWRTMSDAAYATATSYTWDDATDRFEAAIIQVAKVSRGL
jgi:glycosyltransferase involved in cell wall biosynthesis